MIQSSGEFRRLGSVDSGFRRGFRTSSGLAQEEGSAAQVAACSNLVVRTTTLHKCAAVPRRARM